MHQIRFQAGLRPGPRWGNSRCSPRPLVGWGGGHPSPLPSPRRLDSHAFGVRLGALLPAFCHFFHSLRTSFNDHFPGETGLVGFIGAKDDGDDDHNWNNKMSSYRHQQTNTQLFTGQMYFLSPNRVKALRGNKTSYC